VRLPANVTPAARARRALLADVLIALAITAAVVVLSAGIGVVGFGAAISLVVLGVWFALERLLRLVASLRDPGRHSGTSGSRGSRRTRTGPSSPPSSAEPDGRRGIGGRAGG
jgi:hypothetical protein